jgi:hypothetical protein
MLLKRFVPYFLSLAIMVAYSANARADFILEIESATVNVANLPQTIQLGVSLTPVSPSTGFLNFSLPFNISPGLTNPTANLADFTYSNFDVVQNSPTLGGITVFAENGTAISPAPGENVFFVAVTIESATVGQTFTVSLANAPQGGSGNLTEIVNQDEVTFSNPGGSVSFPSGSMLTGTITAVPEPSTWILGFLLATGSVVAGWDRWKKQRA